MTPCCADQDHREPPAAGRRPASATGFGQDEALAFWRGMRDRPGSLGVSLLASWLEDLFAIRPRPAFADPRLESIRRVTVALRHGLERQGAIELGRAREEGLSEQQIAAIRFRLRGGPMSSREAA